MGEKRPRFEIGEIVAGKTLTGYVLGEYLGIVRKTDALSREEGGIPQTEHDLSGRLMVGATNDGWWCPRLGRRVYTIRSADVTEADLGPDEPLDTVL